MAVPATFQAMGLQSERAVSTHLLLENAYESNLVSDISKVDYMAGNLGCTHLPPSPAFRRSSTTSMYLATCAARIACSMAGIYLAQPGRTALRRTPLRGYLPPLESAWGRPSMALPAATYRQTSSTQSQPETTSKAAPSERQSPGSSTTPTKRCRDSGESYTRIQNRPVSSWQR